jgi:hypothetical protein
MAASFMLAVLIQRRRDVLAITAHFSKVGDYTNQPFAPDIAWGEVVAQWAVVIPLIAIGQTTKLAEAAPRDRTQPPQLYSSNADFSENGMGTLRPTGSNFTQLNASSNVL